MISAPVYALEVDYSTSVDEFGAVAVCCLTQKGGSSDTCGSCWPESYEYARVVSFELNSTKPVTVEVKRLSEREGAAIRRAILDENNGARLVFSGL